MEPLTLEALENVTDLYARVSTTEQAMDPGYSGASIDRPWIREVIADVKRGRCRKVIVWKTL